MYIDCKWFLKQVKKNPKFGLQTGTRLTKWSYTITKNFEKYPCLQVWVAASHLRSRGTGSAHQYTFIKGVCTKCDG